MDLISVVIPVYNHEEELEKALRSLVDQTYPYIEVIVVDDGSHIPVQLSYRVHTMFKERDEKFGNHASLELIRQDNTGAPTARNNGLALATGEYVIFWDADVVAKKDMLKKMHNVLTIHREASYVYCNMTFGKRIMKGQKFDSTDLRENNYIHSTSLVRKDQAILWDVHLKRFQDWDYWLSMAAQQKTGIWIPEVLFHVIPRTNGISSWLPSFAYKSPWKFLPWFAHKVHAYEEAKEVVMRKHGLTPSS